MVSDVLVVTCAAISFERMELGGLEEEEGLVVVGVLRLDGRSKVVAEEEEGAGVKVVWILLLLFFFDVLVVLRWWVVVVMVDVC